MNHTSVHTTATNRAETSQAELLAWVATMTPEHQDARALEYVMATGCCSTCLVDGEDPTIGDAELATLPACPACGVRSVEYELAAQIDALVTQFVGQDALEKAVFGA